MRAYVNDDNTLTVNLGNGMGSFRGYPKELFGVGAKLDIRNDYIEQFWGVKTVTDGTRITCWSRSPSPRADSQHQEGNIQRPSDDRILGGRDKDRCQVRRL